MKVHFHQHGCWGVRHHKKTKTSKSLQWVDFYCFIVQSLGCVHARRKSEEKCPRRVSDTAKRQKTAKIHRGWTFAVFILQSLGCCPRTVEK